jgi:hypothetical protein
LALKGINVLFVLIGASVFITVVDCNPIAADNMQIRLTDKQNSRCYYQRGKVLEIEDGSLGDELNEEEIERLSRGRY